jgi:putative ABC transport system permease protein
MQETFKSRLEKILPGISVISADSSLEVMGGISKISNQFALIVSIVAVIGAILLIVRSMAANLMTRANQIGILKAVGWTSKDVHSQIMGEAIIQSLAGGVFGLVVGYLSAYLLANVPVSVAGPAQMSQMPSVARNSEMALSSTVTLPVHLSAELIVASLIISVFSGLLAGYLMGRRTDSMKPADIMREL